jgi:hypothetical protein
MTKEKQTIDIRTLIPGEKLEFEQFDVMVYPLGFRQIRNFTETLIQALRIALSQIKLDSFSEDNESAKKVGMELVSILTPIAARDLMGIIRDCLSVKTKNGEDVPELIDYLPHWCVAPVIGKWLEMSFIGEDKINPWIEAVKKISESIKKMDLSLLSEALSK